MFRRRLVIAALLFGFAPEAGSAETARNGPGRGAVVRIIVCRQSRRHVDTTMPVCRAEMVQRSMTGRDPGSGHRHPTSHPEPVVSKSKKMLALSTKRRIIRPVFAV
jgi:hypothetical protein